MQYFEGESKKTSEEQLTEMLKKVPDKVDGYVESASKNWHQRIESNIALDDIVKQPVSH